MELRHNHVWNHLVLQENARKENVQTLNLFVIKGCHQNLKTFMLFEAFLVMMSIKTHQPSCKYAVTLLRYSHSLSNQHINTTDHHCFRSKREQSFRGTEFRWWCMFSLLQRPFCSCTETPILFPPPQATTHLHFHAAKLHESVQSYTR